MPGLFPSLKLTYFDLADRAEAVRITLHLGSVPFIDERLTQAQFQLRKPSLPYGVMPVLYVDGEPLAESLGILRYAARLAGLYPVNDAFAAMLVDEVLDTDDDLFDRHFSASFMEKDPEKIKHLREEQVAGPLPKTLEIMDKRLQEIGKYPLFASSSKDQIFVHEVLVWDYVEMFISGALEFIPTDLVKKYGTMMAIHEKVAAHSKVQGWLAMAKAPKMIKLTYFDMPGRAEPIRMAFHIGGVEFEDERISFEDCAARKLEFPYGQIPVLTVDGRVAAQSHALLRYAGTRAGLYPATDPLQAMKIDEVIGHLNELFMALEPSMQEQDPQKQREMQETYTRETIPQSLLSLDKRLAHWKVASGNAPFAVGTSLSIADLLIYSTFQFLRSGFLTHVSTAVMDADAYSNILRASDAVAKHPRVQEWTALHASATTHA